MRILLLPLIVMIIINSVVDYYIFNALSRRLPLSYRWIKWCYVAVSAVLLAIAIVAVSLPLRNGTDTMLMAVNWLLYIYITCYIPKYIFVIFDLSSRLPVLFGKRRIKWIGRTGEILGFVVFVLFWWGALINRFNINVKEVTVEIKGLPESFEGYTILQFSDFHVGTYGNDTAFVSEVVKCIDSLHPDAIFFTGDIVNRHTSELLPFVTTLSRLYAPDGIKAILGNHDYGDYYDWDNVDSKKENMLSLYRLFDEMGWKLLLNETDWIVRGNDSIAIIGVENIGDPPFPVYGSLSAAYPDTGDEKIKVLLTHNPAHWVDSISGHDDMNIALTLSGHTHAMQVELGGVSPAALRYKTWGGRYEDEDTKHKLYVNIGLGTVGLPMRIGASPELTLLTLTGAPSR